MDLEKLTGDGEILEEEEQDGRSYSVDFRPETSPEEAREERWERSGRIYRNFVQPVVDEMGEEFTPEEVSEEIRPPYSQEEIQAALEYGVEEEGLEYAEEGFSS